MPDPDWLQKARAEGRILNETKPVSLPPAGEPIRNVANSTDGISIVLSFPPTVNTYWRSVMVNGRLKVLISKRGRQYAKDVLTSVALSGYVPLRLPLVGPLAIDVEACPPNKRRRDLDNLLKSLLDAMGKAGVYGDDSQIHEIRLRWGKQVKGGCVRVSLTPM